MTLTITTTAGSQPEAVALLAHLSKIQAKSKPMPSCRVGPTGTTSGRAAKPSAKPARTRKPRIDGRDNGLSAPLPKLDAPTSSTPQAPRTLAELDRMLRHVR